MLPSPLGLVNRISHSSCTFFQSLHFPSLPHTVTPSFFAGLGVGSTSHEFPSTVPVRRAYKFAWSRYSRDPASPGPTEGLLRLPTSGSRRNVSGHGERSVCRYRPVSPVAEDSSKRPAWSAVHRDG